MSSRDSLRDSSREKVHGIGCPFRAEFSSNSRRRPRLFDWTGDRGQATIPTTVYIDNYIERGVDASGSKLAWLLESPAILRSWGVESFIRQNLEVVVEAYDVILTSGRELCELHPKILYHPAGSNLPWVPEERYRVYEKHKLCSMFASKKQMIEGHQIRHHFARRFAEGLDLFGGALGSPRLGDDSRHPDKLEGLAPYMFSIVMENCRIPFYYSEKITDCFATGTVPVYWGSGCEGEVFDTAGIITLDRDFELSTLSEDLYRSMRPAIERNLEIVRRLESADDLLYARYLDPKRA